MDNIALKPLDMFERAVNHLFIKCNICLNQFSEVIYKKTGNPCYVTLDT